MLGTVVVGCRPRMYRKVGIWIDAGIGDLGEKRLLAVLDKNGVAKTEAGLGLVGSGGDGDRGAYLG